MRLVTVVVSCCRLGQRGPLSRVVDATRDDLAGCANGCRRLVFEKPKSKKRGIATRAGDLCPARPVLADRLTDGWGPLYYCDFFDFLISDWTNRYGPVDDEPTRMH